METELAGLNADYVTKGAVNSSLLPDGISFNEKMERGWSTLSTGKTFVTNFDLASAEKSGCAFVINRRSGLMRSKDSGVHSGTDTAQVSASLTGERDESCFPGLYF
jgi:hypothetical protein